MEEYNNNHVDKIFHGDLSVRGLSRNIAFDARSGLDLSEFEGLILLQ